MELTVPVLSRICQYAPVKRLVSIAGPLNACLEAAEATTPLRAAMLVAQLAHESAEFKYAEELASGDAYDLAVNPRLAAKLGNTRPGDGRKYKGRGWIQLTGRRNYVAAGASLGLQLEAYPQLASDPLIAARVAAWFWREHGCNATADAADVEACTRLINGGLTGIEQRTTYYERAREALGAT